MSVILKALQSQKEGEKQPKEILSPGEGVFLGRRGFVQQEKKSFPKKNPILAALLILVVAFSATMIWFGRAPKTPAPTVPSVPLAPVVVLPPPPVVTAPPPSAPVVEESKNPDENLKLLQQALKQNPEDSQLHNDIGLLYIRKELYSSAETHFTKALELDPSCAECFNNLGYLKTVLGQAVEAEKYLKKSILLQANYADPHFNLGVLYEKKGDIGEAVIAFQRFLELKGADQSEVTIQLKHHLKELTGK